MKAYELGGRESSFFRSTDSYEVLSGLLDGPAWGGSTGLAGSVLSERRDAPLKEPPHGLLLP